MIELIYVNNNGNLVGPFANTASAYFETQSNGGTIVRVNGAVNG